MKPRLSYPTSSELRATQAERDSAWELEFDRMELAESISREAPEICRQDSRPVIGFSSKPSNTVNKTSQEIRKMVLKYKENSKNGKDAIYSGAAVPVRFKLTAFPGGTAPAEIDVNDGVFAEARTPKSKLTKEERAALPKPTLAERVKKQQERLARMQAKLAGGTADVSDEL